MTTETPHYSCAARSKRALFDPPWTGVITRNHNRDLWRCRHEHGTVTEALECARQKLEALKAKGKA